MDDGIVIPGLEEGWSLFGAKLTEWATGFMTFMLASEFLVEKPSSAMPLLLAIWVGTTFFVAGIRKKFPDEERGMANMFLVNIGVEPPGIPTPAKLQPVWSGAPIESIKEKLDYSVLELDLIFNSKDHDESDE